MQNKGAGKKGGFTKGFSGKTEEYSGGKGASSSGTLPVSQGIARDRIMQEVDAKLNALEGKMQQEINTVKQATSQVIGEVKSINLKLDQQVQTQSSQFEDLKRLIMASSGEDSNM